MLSLKLSRGAAPSEDPSMSTTYIIEGELNMYICTMYASWAPHIHDTSHHVMWRVACAAAAFFSQTAFIAVTRTNECLSE